MGDNLTFAKHWAYMPNYSWPVEIQRHHKKNLSGKSYITSLKKQRNYKGSKQQIQKQYKVFFLPVSTLGNLVPKPEGKSSLGVKNTQIPQQNHRFNSNTQLQQ